MNAIRRWSAFNQTQQQQMNNNGARAAKGQQQSQDDGGEEEEMEELEVSEEEDESAPKQMATQTRVANRLQTINSGGFAGTPCFDYEERPYGATNIGQNSLPLAVGGNCHLALEHGHTPDSSPNGSPYSSVSSVKNFPISHQRQNTSATSQGNNMVATNASYQQDPAYHRYSGVDFQSNPYHPNINQVTSRPTTVHYTMSQHQPTGYHPISPYSTQHLPHMMHQHHQQQPQHQQQQQQQQQQHHPQHQQSSPHMQQHQYYPPPNPTMMHQQQHAVNLSYTNQTQNYSMAGTNHQSTGPANTFGTSHLAGLNHYGQHPRGGTTLPPSELAPIYGGGGGSVGGISQFSNPHTHNQQQMVSNMSQASPNNMQQFYELQSAASISSSTTTTTHEQQQRQQHETSTPLDVSKNHDMRQQQQRDDFKAAATVSTTANSTPTNIQQPQHGSPLNYHDSNLSNGCNSSSSSGIGTNAATSSSSSSSLEQYSGSGAGGNGSNNLHTHHQHHQQQQQHHQQQQHLQLHHHQVQQQQHQRQQMLADQTQSNHSTGLDYASSVLQPGDPSQQHQPQNFQHQQQENNHAASSGNPGSCSEPSPAQAPYNLSTATSTMNYNHGQLSGLGGSGGVGSEYNLTTLQATRSRQQQNQHTGLTQDGSNQLDHKRQDLHPEGGSMTLDSRATYHQQQQHQGILQDHHSQIVTTNMMLLDSNNHAACNAKAYTSVNSQQTLVSTSLALNGQQQLDSIVKSFPTPEMSPLDSPDKSMLYSSGPTGYCGGAILTNERETTLRQATYNPYNQQSSPQLRGESHSEADSGEASAVSKLIARFGDQSTVLKSVQPPYKYRMIVSASVANSVSDLSIQQQMRESFSTNGVPSHHHTNSGSTCHQDHFSVNTGSHSQQINGRSSGSRHSSSGDSELETMQNGINSRESSTLNSPEHHSHQQHQKNSGDRDHPGDQRQTTCDSPKTRQQTSAMFSNPNWEGEDKD